MLSIKNIFKPKARVNEAVFNPNDLGALHSLLMKMSIGTGDQPGIDGENFALTLVRDQLLAMHGQEKELTLFDLGANTGAYLGELTEVFAQTNYKVHSFEPSQSSLAKLKAKFSANPSVIIVNKAISSKSGTAVLYSDRETSGMASLVRRDLEYLNIDHGKTEETVTTSTVDEYCQQNKIERIDFMKLDIEGLELEAFKGASAQLPSTSFLQFEFGGCNIDTRTYFKDFFMLLNPQFKIYRILKDSLCLIPEYNQLYEQFQTTNFLCVNRSIETNW